MCIYRTGLWPALFWCWSQLLSWSLSIYSNWLYSHIKTLTDSTTHSHLFELKNKYRQERIYGFKYLHCQIIIAWFMTMNSLADLLFRCLLKVSSLSLRYSLADLLACTEYLDGFLLLWFETDSPNIDLFDVWLNFCFVWYDFSIAQQLNYFKFWAVILFLFREN